MAAQPRKMSSKLLFSKFLTDTDIKKRLAIPGKILPSLPAFNGRHTVNINLMHGTRSCSIVCSIRKKGYKKPVFSVGWRKFVISNKLRIGDKITLYKVQDEDEECSSRYRIELEKPSREQSGVLPPPALSLNHEVNETTVTCRRKVRNLGQQQLPTAPDAPIKQEGAAMDLANVATMGFLDHVTAKPPVRIVGINLSDEANSKAHFKNEHETRMMGLGITKDTGMGEPPLLSHYMTKEEREINFFGLAEGGAMPYGSSQLAAAGEARYKSSTDQMLCLDLVQRQPSPYAGEVNLDLTLAPPIVDGGVQKKPLFAHPKQG